MVWKLKCAIWLLVAFYILPYPNIICLEGESKLIVNNYWFWVFDVRLALNLIPDRLCSNLLKPAYKAETKCYFEIFKKNQPLYVDLFYRSGLKVQNCMFTNHVSLCYCCLAIICQDIVGLWFVCTYLRTNNFIRFASYIDFEMWAGSHRSYHWVK